MAFLTVKIPKECRHGLIDITLPDHARVIIANQTDLFGARDQLVMELMGFRPGLANARQIAFDISGKDGNARFGKPFSQNLQRNRFPRACRAGNKAVAIGELK